MLRWGNTVPLWSGTLLCVCLGLYIFQKHKHVTKVTSKRLIFVSLQINLETFDCVGRNEVQNISLFRLRNDTENPKNM